MSKHHDDFKKFLAACPKIRGDYVIETEILRTRNAKGEVDLNSERIIQTTIRPAGKRTNRDRLFAQGKYEEQVRLAENLHKQGVAYRVILDERTETKGTK